MFHGKCDPLADQAWQIESLPPLVGGTLQKPGANVLRRWSPLFERVLSQLLTGEMINNLGLWRRTDNGLPGTCQHYIHQMKWPKKRGVKDRIWFSMLQAEQPLPVGARWFKTFKLLETSKENWRLCSSHLNLKFQFTPCFACPQARVG